MEIDFPPMNNRIYKVKYVYDGDPYPEDSYMSWHPIGRRTQHPGRKSGGRYGGKQILRYQYRMYRTWKYNRKTQWKSE